jgi:probable F420-dependent oxidoreductase
MKVGLNIISMNASEFVAGTVMAEELGYDSIWYGEHIMLPHGTEYVATPQPYGPQELLDVFVLLGHLAGKTKRIRLATGIVMLPLRAPVLAARQILGVDVLSEGRFDLAVGLGWHPDEYAVSGTNMKTRGARLDEMLELINELFQPGDTEFSGKYYLVPNTPFDPKPVQKPRPPFLVGGGSEAALRRAARWDGWYGVCASPEGAAQSMERINGYRREYGRENEPFEYVLAFYQGGPAGCAPPREELEKYVALGIERFVVTPWDFDHDNALSRIAEYAREIDLTS